MKHLSLLFALFPAHCLPPQCTTERLFVVLLCWLRKTPTDKTQLTGWWLRKATCGGVVMATEACQTDCWNWTSMNTQSIPTTPPPPTHPVQAHTCMSVHTNCRHTPIWHLRHRIYAVKICWAILAPLSSSALIIIISFCHTVLLEYVIYFS